MIFLLYNYLRCYISDPGIIPKNSDSLKKQERNIPTTVENISTNGYNFLTHSNNSKDLNLEMESNSSKNK